MTQRHWLHAWVLAAVTGSCFLHPAFALDSGKAMSQYVHDAWGADRGFLGGAVYAISQSADGYLWIGTERGLVRFDGTDFTLMERPLPDRRPTGPVLGLVSDGQGEVWARPEGQQLLLYRDGKFDDAFALYDIEENTFTAMSADGRGGFLLCGLENHAFHYRDGAFESIASADEVPGTVISLAETFDGSIWFGTRDNGLFRMTRGGPAAMAVQLAGMKINVLQPAANGGLWIGTDHGLYFWDGRELGTAGLPRQLSQLQILAMTRDREGNVWVGTDQGIVRIAPLMIASLDLLHQGPDAAVTTVFEDRDGEIWYGGSQGIERLRDGMFTTYTTTEGLPSDGNGAVYADADGRTWFAPLAGGLYWLKDGRVGRITLDGLADDVVYSISGGGGEIWVGRQRGGLTVLKENGENWTARSYTQADGLAQDSVYSVHRDRDGTVWAGTVSGGISRLKDGVFTNYSTANGLASNAVNSIAEGYDGTEWFATPNGLESYADGRWTNHTTHNGLPSSNVKSLFEDSKHVLWSATAGGLAYLSSSNIGTPWNLPDSLREQIFGMGEDNLGSLWFVTSDHVLRVNREQLLENSLGKAGVRSYGIADGLEGVEGVSRDRSMTADARGQIWISLNRGIAVADPQLTIVNSQPAMVRIDSMSAGSAQVDFRQMAKIAPGSGSITFNYAGTSLAAPDQARYRYKLDGFNREWSGVVATRQVTYTNLGPGTYRFRIVASDGEGLWNGPQTTVGFVIERAFWQTWWFIALCVTAGMLALLGIYRLRMYQMTRRLSARFQERLAERTRIARDLHDTLLQGVLSASMQLDLAEDQLPDDSPTKPRLRRVMDLLGQVTEEGRGTLQGLRATESNQASLERALSRVKQDLGNEEDTGYRVVVRGAPIALRPLIRDEVYRIGREAVVNALGHAHATSIEVEVEYADRQFRMLVRDDGFGIDPQVLQQGREGHWGLSGMRERSEGIGATLRLRSRIGAGTEIELSLPGAVAYEKRRSGPEPKWRRWLGREKPGTESGQEERRVSK